MVSALASRSQLRQFDHARLSNFILLAARFWRLIHDVIVIERNCEKFPQAEISWQKCLFEHDYSQFLRAEHKCNSVQSRSGATALRRRRTYLFAA
jgi:hypothetical protein